MDSITMNWLSIIAKFALIPVYAYLAMFFKKGYQKSKEEGFENKFFVGFFCMFLVLLIYQSGGAIYTLVREFIPTISYLENDFPNAGDYKEIFTLFDSWYWNLAHKPIHLIGMISVTLLFAAQVYPVEIINGWDKTILTKTMIYVSTPMQILLFIESLRWSYFLYVAMSIALICLLFAIFLNIGTNLKLAIQTTGEVRKRSIRIVVAFFLFFLGFVWTLEVGWAQSITFWVEIQNDYKWDIIIGSIVQTIGAFLYRSGFIAEK